MLLYSWGKGKSEWWEDACKLFTKKIGHAGPRVLDHEAAP